MEQPPGVRTFLHPSPDMISEITWSKEHLQEGGKLACRSQSFALIQRREEDGPHLGKTNHSEIKQGGQEVVAAK